MRLSCEFVLEAAHSLPRMPEGHKCRRVHGHSYRVVVEIEGEVGEYLGLVVDYALLESVWFEIVHARLDHRNLNDVLGDTPTAETLAAWIATELQPWVPPRVRVVMVEVWETAKFSARWGSK